MRLAYCASLIAIQIEPWNIRRVNLLAVLSEANSSQTRQSA